ncbi:DUF1573 domain-containing protein [Luteolibacter arcticus]|uniref:DUF1573 domain-containing protein n=1 Tax=Luteolibacter arcticus TaxID=1581411 RepID=A0ABT3GMD4_9BACT|nr:DUF1573 domain-containing protein [Luteolibacter arcticus]MCW1924657.1 DUF1573 domain-containing protein [Luteolibacter arcticus]
MKVLLICWLAACLPLAAGTLKFEKTRKDAVVENDQKTVTVDFDFKNESDSDASIEKYDAGCPCATVGVKDSKMTYKPGETGTVRIAFDLGMVPGTMDKAVAIYIKGDAANHPSVTLTSHIVVPALVEVEPKSLMWDVGSKPEPKTVTVTMKHTEPIKILSMTGADPRFKQELKTIEEGKKYEIVITPASTEKVGMGVVHLETDCKFDRHRSQRVFMVVRQPLAKKDSAAAVKAP